MYEISNLLRGDPSRKISLSATGASVYQNGVDFYKIIKIYFRKFLNFENCVFFFRKIEWIMI